MPEIEHRRHSWREPPAEHLTQKGVDLARRVGETMGHFQLVVTSDLPVRSRRRSPWATRLTAREALLGDDGGLADQVDWTLGCAELARAFRQGTGVAQACRAQAALLRSIAVSLPPEGRALLVSHGGIIEQGVVGLLPELQFETWGPAFERCEGVLIRFEANVCVAANPLRLPAGWQ